MTWYSDSIDMASECIDDIRSRISAVEFGYKVQAIAAHVLLRLGYRVNAINQRGHPDVVAFKGGHEFRFEIEAEAGRPRPRRLTEADFATLMSVPDGFGYYALAVCIPAPKWILVRASKLVYRRYAVPNVLLEALSDMEYSEEWTSEYVSLLNESCDQIRKESFERLKAAVFRDRDG